MHSYLYLLVLLLSDSIRLTVRRFRIWIVCVAVALTYPGHAFADARGFGALKHGNGQQIGAACIVASGGRYHCRVGPSVTTAKSIGLSRVGVLNRQIDFSALFSLRKDISKRSAGQVVLRGLVLGTLATYFTPKGKVRAVAEKSKAGAFRTGDFTPSWRIGDEVSFTGVYAADARVTAAGSLRGKGESEPPLDDDTIDWIFDEMRSSCKERLRAAGCELTPGAGPGYSIAIGVDPQGFIIHETCECHSPPQGGPADPGPVPPGGDWGFPERLPGADPDAWSVSIDTSDLEDALNEPLPISEDDEIDEDRDDDDEDDDDGEGPDETEPETPQVLGR